MHKILLSLPRPHIAYEQNDRKVKGKQIFNGREKNKSYERTGKK